MKSCKTSGQDSSEEPKTRINFLNEELQKSPELTASGDSKVDKVDTSKQDELSEHGNHLTQSPSMEPEPIYDTIALFANHVSADPYPRLNSAGDTSSENASRDTSNADKVEQLEQCTYSMWSNLGTVPTANLIDIDNPVTTRKVLVLPKVPAKDFSSSADSEVAELKEQVKILTKKCLLFEATIKQTQEKQASQEDNITDLLSRLAVCQTDTFKTNKRILLIQRVLDDEASNRKQIEVQMKTMQRDIQLLR